MLFKSSNGKIGAIVCQPPAEVIAEYSNTSARVQANEADVLDMLQPGHTR